MKRASWKQKFNREPLKKLCSDDYAAYNNKYNSLSDSLDKYLLTICFGALAFYLSFVGKLNITKLTSDYYWPIVFIALSIFLILLTFELNKLIIKKNIDITLMQSIILEEICDVVSVEDYDTHVNTLKNLEFWLFTIDAIKYVVIVEAISFCFTTMFFINNPLLGREIRNACNFILSIPLALIFTKGLSKNLKHEIFKKIIDKLNNKTAL